MSGEEESDDSTTIRRKILLSPTMPPRDSIEDHDGSPLANLIGQVRTNHPPALLIQNTYWTVSRKERWPATKSL